MERSTREAKPTQLVFPEEAVPYGGTVLVGLSDVSPLIDLETVNTLANNTTELSLPQSLFPQPLPSLPLSVCRGRNQFWLSPSTLWEWLSVPLSLRPSLKWRVGDVSTSPPHFSYSPSPPEQELLTTSPPSSFVDS